MGDFVALLCCVALEGLLLLCFFIFSHDGAWPRLFVLLLLLLFFDGLLLLGDLFFGDLLLRDDLTGDGPGLGVLGIFGRYLLD